MSVNRFSLLIATVGILFVPLNVQAQTTEPPVPSICSQNWGVVNSVDWMTCALLSNEKLFTDREQERIERLCGCRGGAVLDGIACTVDIDDCGTMRCSQTTRINEIELFGMFASIASDDCKTLKTDLQRRRSQTETSSANVCYATVCAANETKTCQSSRIMEDCYPISGAYDYWDGGFDATSSFVVPTQFTNPISIASLRVVKAALSNVLGVNQDEILFLMPEMTKSTALIWAPRMTSASVGGMLYQNKTVLQQVIRPTVPSYCTSYPASTPNVSLGTSCTNILPPPANCTKNLCDCYGLKGNQTCVPHYRTSATASKSCLQTYWNCMESSVFGYARGVEACRTSYNSITPDSAFSSCMSDLCTTSDFVFNNVEADVRAVCTDVKTFVQKLSPFGSAVTPLPTLPGTTTLPPTPSPPTLPPTVTPTPTPNTTAPPNTTTSPAPNTTAPSTTSSPSNTTIPPRTTSAPNATTPAPTSTNTSSNTTNSTTKMPSNSSTSNTTASNSSATPTPANKTNAPSVTPTSNSSRGAAASEGGSSSDDGGFPMGAIIGIVVGVVLAIAGGGGLLYMRQRTKGAEEIFEEMQASPAPAKSPSSLNSQPYNPYI